MKNFIKVCLIALFLSVSMSATSALAGVAGADPTPAAASPGLGAAGTFGVLSSTYTNISGTTITGDLGYTTGPGVAPTVSGTTYVAPNATYTQAGLDQATALSYLNSQACTFNFASGAINLATDTTHGAVGIYTPGVYCITGAASIGTAGITLDGAGTYIFRMDGALNTVVDSDVRLINNASECNVFWTPTAATTLAATSTFAGTNIDAAGITIGDTVTWIGAALAFGETVTTTNDTITLPICTSRAASPGIAIPGTDARVTVTATATTTATATPAPAMPNTGNNPSANNAPWVIIISGGMATSLILLYTILKKKRI